MSVSQDKGQKHIKKSERQATDLEKLPVVHKPDQEYSSTIKSSHKSMRKRLTTQIVGKPQVLCMRGCSTVYEEYKSKTNMRLLSPPKPQCRATGTHVPLLLVGV